MKRQALVAANMMVVRAAVFVAGVADQECASDQLVIAAARLAAEAAAANVRNRMAEMLLVDRTLARPGLATIVGHRERTLPQRSEEHTSELQSLMRISYAVFCLKK